MTQGGFADPTFTVSLSLSVPPFYLPKGFLDRRHSSQFSWDAWPSEGRNANCRFVQGHIEPSGAGGSKANKGPPIKGSFVANQWTDSKTN